ncbi:MAG: hypothetical protein V8R95_10885 [Faecalibacterium sp.]
MKNRKNRPVNGKVFRSGVYSTAILAAAILLAVLVNLVVRALPSKYTSLTFRRARCTPWATARCSWHKACSRM